MRNLLIEETIIVYKGTQKNPIYRYGFPIFYHEKLTMYHQKNLD